MLSTVDMVVQRRDGPRRLRDHDNDDNDDVYLPGSFVLTTDSLSVTLNFKIMYVGHGRGPAERFGLD